jgi:protein CpxP
MKKIIISFLVMLLLIGGNVNAQKKQKGNADAKLKAQVEVVKTGLSLNDDQATKVSEILVGIKSQTDSLRTANKGGDKKALNKLLKPIRNTRDAKIKAILTPEQATQYEAKKTEFFKVKAAATDQ